LDPAVDRIELENNEIITDDETPKPMEGEETENNGTAADDVIRHKSH